MDGQLRGLPVFSTFSPEDRSGNSSSSHSLSAPRGLLRTSTRNLSGDDLNTPLYSSSSQVLSTKEGSGGE